MLIFVCKIKYTKILTCEHSYFQKYFRWLYTPESSERDLREEIHKVKEKAEGEDYCENPKEVWGRRNA
jgi:hypothetical protein